MKKESKKVGKKLLSGCVVLSMILSAMTLLVTSSEPVISQETPETYEPSLRVYGEENAVYPTQSYTEGKDFVYPYLIDPFDPGIIAKDSITFNSAYIDYSYQGAEHVDKCITIDGEDSDEKVFLRLFYEPEYYHVIDELMDVEYNQLEPVDFELGAVTLEYTYMLLSHCGDPITGHGIIPDNKNTHFMLPVRSADDTIPGMEDADMVDLKEVFFDYRNDAANNEYNGNNYLVSSPADQEVGGAIDVQQSFDDLSSGTTKEFMDHRITYTGRDVQDQPLVTIEYIGNMPERNSEKPKTFNLYQKDDEFWFDRANNGQTYSDQSHRWFVSYTDVVQGSGNINLVVGRRLVAGETFYVNGVRYDMPAVYVEEIDVDEYAFKYITFQTPIPKGEPYCTDTPDWSHVTSQWLKNLPPEYYAWLLSPFNEQHIMIDDIGLEKVNRGNVDIEVPVAGLILDDLKDALKFHYIAETDEPRFDTSLAERPDADAWREGYEPWTWYNVYTLPKDYTEFVLPNQEIAGEYYTDEYYCNDIPDWYLWDADGAEYLLTSSFIAPNSYVSPDERDDYSKTSWEQHDILDRANVIDYNDQRADKYMNMPRMVFEFDAVNGLDLYINDVYEGAQEPSIRVYGEEYAVYPTQSYTDELDFVYNLLSDPFDPGAVTKDSITFNPAYIDYTYLEAERPDKLITVDGENSDEKVFLRLFYEPEYYHVIDELMDVKYDQLMPVDFELGAVTLEYTYMLLSHDGLPITGHGLADNENTYFMLPVRSTDDTIPGMEDADMVDLKEVFFDYRNDAANNEYNGNNYLASSPADPMVGGAIDVQQSFTDLPPYTPVEFMDHRITYTGCNVDNEPLVTIEYIGNMPERNAEKPKSACLGDINTLIWFDRTNVGQSQSDQSHRWFVSYSCVRQNPYGAAGNIDITIGRRLVAGETFYVNGVRYDMPAIYVEGITAPGQDILEYAFKYITFQTPIPKGEPYCTDTPDWSHVTSQWLKNLPPEYDAWLLSPFNEYHVMIDDIGLEKKDFGYPYVDVEIPAEGLILDDVKDPLEFYYIAETDEPRFDTGLAERADADWDVDYEPWTWYNVYTLPKDYTEFVLPNQEIAGEDYTDSYFGNDIPGWYNWDADGAEYLLTSSWIAPNSHENPEYRDNVSKESWEQHDIISKVGGGNGNGGVFEKSAYLIADHHTAQFDAWGIANDGTANYQASYALVFAEDPAGIAIDESSKTLFVTTEFSSVGAIFEFVDATTMTSLGYAGGGTNFGGIDTDDENDIIYTVVRGSNQLYAYDWNPTGPSVTPKTGFPKTLPDCESAFGISLDKKAGILWVADPGSGMARAYNTSTWLQDAKSFTPSHYPVDIAVDRERGIVYTVSMSLGASVPGGAGSDKISKYDLATTTETTQDLGHQGVGIAVDENSGYVYVTGDRNAKKLEVWDASTSPWIQVDVDTTSGSPAGICIPKENIAFGAVYCPRVAFEFDAEDGTGIYINEQEGGNEPSQLPTAEANGPYSTSDLCNEIEFSCVGSHDNDEGQSSITHYRWDWTNDGSWDTVWLGFSDPTQTYAYCTEFHGWAKVEVKDDEGQTDTDTAKVDVGDGGGSGDDVTISMDDVCDNHWGYLVVNDVSNLGSCDVTLSWDPDVATVTDFGDSDLQLQGNVDNVAGTLIISAYTGGSGLNGDVTIAKITFEPAARPSATGCPLEITSSLLSDATAPIANDIPHSRDDGYYTVDCDGSDVPGDMNGDGNLNSADVRYLAKHIVGDPGYSTLHASGDVNCDGNLNSADVRYLAKHIVGDSGYENLYPTC